MLSSRIVALGDDGTVQANVALQAVLPPHDMIYRYPLGTWPSMSTWYPDFASNGTTPLAFEYVGTFGARYDVLRVSDPGVHNLQPAEWRGRLYTCDAHVSPDNGAVVTASLWVDAVWVDDAPANPMATEVVVDLALGDTSVNSETIFRLHMGFDNADEAWRDYGPFAFMYLDGPLTTLLGTPDVWPFSPLGSILAFGFPGPNPRKVSNWQGVVRLNAWNDFSFSVLRVPGDTGLYKGVPRECQETVKIEFWLNGTDCPLAFYTSISFTVGLTPTHPRISPLARVSMDVQR